MLKEVKELLKDLKEMLIAMIPVFIIGIVMCTIFAFYTPKQAKTSERPNWAVVYNDEYNCYMNTRHYILYLYAQPATIIIHKHGKNCKVIQGIWDVLYNNDLDEKRETNLKKIDIDHIVPWSFLKKIIDEKYYKDVFNLIVNLRPADKKYNIYKSNKICETNTICDYQRSICGLIKIELMRQKIPNRLNCSVFVMK